MEKFTRLFAFIVMTLPILSSCNFISGQGTQGNYQIVNKTIDIPDYDGIIVKINAKATKVVYQQFSDSVPYLQVNIDDNLLSALDIRVENNQLIIDTKPDSLIQPTQFTIYTNSKNLTNAHMSGVGELYLRGEVNAKNFDLDVSGVGNIRTDSLLCEKLNVTVSGVGNAKIIGAANESTFLVSGVGNINAFDFLVQSAKCTVSGVGNIEVYPKDQLDATISGPGSVKYKGAPETINSSVSGPGKLKKAE